MIKGILDKSVMEGPEQQWPLPAHSPLGATTEHMAKENGPITGLELIAVLAEELGWSGEAEAHEATGLVFDDLVADRSVAALTALAGRLRSAWQATPNP